jgi:hypothetical protein
LLREAAQSILDCTRFTEEGLPYLACIRLFSWKRLCNALWALSFQGYHREDELLTALVASIESIGGPWRGLPSNLIRKGKPFERLVTRLYLEELTPFVRAASTPQTGTGPTESVRVLWDQKLPSLAQGKRQIDVLLRWHRDGRESVIVVECRDREVEVTEMDAFVTLIRHVGAERGVMVSSVGFQSGAEACARLENIETRVVTEDDFTQETVERVVALYAFQPLQTNVEPPDNRPPVPILVPPHQIHVLRNGIIGTTLLDLAKLTLETEAPIPGSMPPQFHVTTPDTRLLLPNGATAEMAAIHITTKIVERKQKRTLLLPRRPLSFWIQRPFEGSTRKVEASKVQMFPSRTFQAGCFYVNLMGQAYHCEAVDQSSGDVRLVLLADRQHGDKVIDVEGIATADQAEHYYPVEDPEALKSLKADLARFRTFAVPSAAS